MALSGGFDPAEAVPLMAICYTINNNITGVKPPKTPPPKVDLPIPPPPASFGWEIAYDPGKAVFTDNYWQLWKNTKVHGQYALAFRGTTTNLDSFIEDAVALLVPAKISILGHEVKLAAHAMARVHAGFVAGLAVMLADNIFLKLEEYANLHGMKELFIIGHSQGASLATLCHSFLHYQTIKTIVKTHISLKSYVFAQAKPGNIHFAYDFELMSSQTGSGYSPMGFRVTSDQDWVPQAPFCIQLPSNLSSPNPFSISDLGNSNISKILHELDSLNLELDFAGAGTPIILEAQPGNNPSDPNDYFWQHHAQHYFMYLNEQYK